MALVLIRDLNGKGNAHRDGTPCERDPKTNEQIEPGEALILHTAKAHGMVFIPWLPVKTGDKSQEKAILLHVEANTPGGRKPFIVPMDWGDREMVEKVWERHPHLREGIPEVTEDRSGFVTAMVRLAESFDGSTSSTPRAKTPASERPIVRDYRNKTADERVAAGAALKDAVAARTEEYAEAVYESALASALAEGKDERAAKMIAGRKRAAARRDQSDAHDSYEEAGA